MRQASSATRRRQAVRTQGVDAVILTYTFLFAPAVTVVVTSITSSEGADVLVMVAVAMVAVVPPALVAPLACHVRRSEDHW